MIMRGLLYSLVLMCLVGCSSNTEPENTASNSGLTYEVLTDDFPKLSTRETALLVELGLCVDDRRLIHGKNNIEYDYCDSREYRIIDLGARDQVYEIAAVETSSTHYAGSGGNRIYIYRRNDEKYIEIRSFQGAIKGVRRKPGTHPEIVVAHHDKRVGEVLISHCWKDRSYAPCQLVSINQDSIAPEDYDALYDKYILNFKW